LGLAKQAAIKEQRKRVMSFDNHVQTGTIRIISPPVGEAPSWVREAWVGLEIPVVGSVRSFAWPTHGVTSGPKSLVAKIWACLSGNFQRIDGYRVRAQEAVDILEASRPDAADWWRENASHLLGGSLVFDKAACSTSQVQNSSK